MRTAVNSYNSARGINPGIVLCGVAFALGYEPIGIWLYCSERLLGQGLGVSVLAVLVGIPATTFGATIPALLRGQKHIAKVSGRLVFISSAGYAAGFLLMPLAVHHYFDYGQQLIVVALVSAAALLVYSKANVKHISSALALMAGVTAVYAYAWQEQWLYLGHTSFHGPQQFEAARAKFLNLSSRWLDTN